jgi:hypothetical protein
VSGHHPSFSSKKDGLGKRANKKKRKEKKKGTALLYS